MDSQVELMFPTKSGFVRLRLALLGGPPASRHTLAAAAGPEGSVTFLSWSGTQLPSDGFSISIEDRGEQTDWPSPGEGWQ